jgi:hypothetical protein
MAFQKKGEKKDLSLPGLIDIIFLLLIFSLVTLSVSHTKIEAKRQGSQDVEFDLPKTNNRETKEVDEILNTILFQIEYQDKQNPSGPKMLYVLWPSNNDSLTLIDSKNNAIRDSLYAVYPINVIDLNDMEFTSISPNRLIKRELGKYKNTYFHEPLFSNAVEIRAVKNAEFRIINYILEQCSVYEDTIPQIIIRTLAGE